MGLVLTWPVGRAADSPRADKPPAGPVLAYVVASTTGGAIAGFLISQAVGAASSVSSVASAGVASAAVVMAVVAAGLEWNGRLHPLPERAAQVPRDWLRWHRRSLTAAAFGLMIGSGALTRIKHATVYALAALVVLAPSVGAGALVGALYGLSRSLTLAVTWFGDRVIGTRPRWFAVGTSSRRLNRALAVTALLSLGTALILVP